MTAHRIIEGKCREGYWPNYTSCENGTLDCITHHSVHPAGTVCTRCGTSGGHSFCPARPVGVPLRCTNYAGRFGATIADREASGQS